MKIYIVGSVGSGKSTLARDVLKITGVLCHHLDEVVHIEDPTDLWGNRKRSVEERDALFYRILAEDDCIMEDTGRECFIEGMSQADTVILLEIPLYIRRKRIILRWIKQKIGIEKCIYKPRFDMLKSMFKWTKNYDTGADGTKSRIEPYKDKTVVLRNNREIKQYLMSIS